jgi:hypothetical protein
MPAHEELSAVLSTSNSICVDDICDPWIPNLTSHQHTVRTPLSAAALMEGVSVAGGKATHETKEAQEC